MSELGIKTAAKPHNIFVLEREDKNIYMMPAAGVGEKKHLERIRGSLNP